MVKSKDSILKDYQNNVSTQEAQIRELNKTLNNISLSRLGLFIAEILLVSITIYLGYHWITGILMCIPVLYFMVLVKRQTIKENELNYAEKLLFVFQNEVSVMLTGKNKYKEGKHFEDEYHPYSSDLDIYGHSSLFAFINRSNTVNGMKLLADSLNKPANLEIIRERQAAIIELTGHIGQTFHFRAGLQNHKPEQLEIISYKLEHEMPDQLKFTHNKLLRIYTAIVPFISAVLIILGILYGDPFWKGLGFYAVINIALSFGLGKKINLIHSGFSGSASLLNAISGTVKWTEELKWESKYIKGFFTEKILAVPLSLQIKKLSGIINSFDVRLNMVVGTLYNVFLLWDFRCAIQLDKWFVNSSDQLIKGLYTISQFEELISFATFNHNEPDLTFPVITETFHFEAKELGHPLIAENKRIVNDYNFDTHPTVDIVTGSNMAGKSTFLRTGGINMVLAFSGAPVCAKYMKVSIFEILTYMRIKDSLNDQTSTFKAELNRLKMILEGVTTLSHPLVLIDEMLRGTNSKDKYLGSKVFIQQMILKATPTLFATHDLQLSEMIEKYAGQVRNYHFDIQLAEGEMNFDYKLKEGACKTFNAALLLKEIGLSFNPVEMDS
ncbi:DNA mismatch repair protein MutS [Pedobacter lusitanus]|uniref:DNA mismatch repair protein MutS n=1 Tax=Pedobacter lusitanus TaxID=1503925 RepID=A0A0D0F9M3_9SPHI|nr:DNA mismatch repair protein MutS [Pedobacter lusitanus]KIO78443.1 DNA mismatch repair protein MutS [Pedobacter lusitanus]